MVPGIHEEVEGCPSNVVIVLYLTWSAMLGVFIFFSTFAFGLKKRFKIKREKTLAKS